jgi:hypothetical protein
MSHHSLRLARSFGAAAILALAVGGYATAHVVEEVGPYTVEIGWQHEPTYVGEANAVQVIIHDASDEPVVDLGADDITVVVSTGGQQTGELTFEPGFDPEEMEGPLGEYDAAILPTAPGDYTFHVMGSIHGEPIDVTVTSGDETFNAVQGTAEIQFPDRLPTLPELTTHLDQVDTRIAELQGSAGPSQASVDAAAAAADDAQRAADRALLIGGGVGLVGVLVGAYGVLLAMRASRRMGS